MRKKLLLILISICALSIGTLISASVLYSFSVTMNSTVAPQGSASILIDSGNYTDGASITLDWGTVLWGANNKTITIVNNANTALTPSITTSSLPTGWTLTLSLNQPIPAGQQAAGTLTLYVPTGTAAASYTSMTATIVVSFS